MSFASQTGQWTLLAPILPVVVDAAVKSALVLIAAGVAVGCMRKCSAAARHLVWFLAVASLPLLPVLSLGLPGWHILPQWFDVSKTPTLKQPAAPVVEVASTSPAPIETVVPVAETTVTPNLQPPPISSREGTPFKSPAPPTKASSPASRDRIDRLRLALPVWLAGAALAFLPTVLGLFSLWRLERSSRRETASSWLELLRQLVDRLNFRRAVALLKTDRRRMPMTWGIFRPKLLLPEESHEWPTERRSVVLLHELAHAKRWDYLTNLVTQFICALYWFNPLVWFAAQQMIAERERACDDIVLRHGARPADYAEQILQIAAGLRLDRLAGYGGIAMARSSKLEGRLRAILDAGRNRAALTRFIVLVAIVLLVVVIIPVAMMKAVSGETSNRIAAGPTGIAPTSSPPAFATSTSYPRLITGQVVDADMQKPIPEFTVTPGSPAAPDLLNWDRAKAADGKNGAYQLSTGAADYPTLVLVEAPGYAPEMAAIRTNSILDFQLRKGGMVEGTVLDPTGRPLANAQILFQVKYSLVHLESARFRYPFWIANSPDMQRSPESFTDGDGKFSLPATAGAVAFLAVHESGFAEQRFPRLPLGSNTTIRLRPWARIEGTLLRGAQPLTNDLVSLSTSNYWGRGFELRLSQTNGIPSTTLRANTDDSGRFIFDHVPRGDFWLDWTDPITGKRTMRWPVKTEAEKTAVVELNILNSPRTSTTPSVEISLGIRNVTGIEFHEKRQFKYPLAFRIRNIGQTNLSGGKILQMMMSKSVVHARSAEGVEQQDAFRRFWVGPTPKDLSPGEIYVDWVYGDLLSFFPSATNGVYEVWWMLGDPKSNSLRFKVSNGEMTLVTDPVVVSSAAPPQLIEPPPQPKGNGAISVRERIEQLIRTAPSTTNLDLEIWEPGARNAFAVRSNVVQLGYYNESGLDSNSVFGMVYRLPAQNRFYIGWGEFRNGPNRYYGPFRGNPFDVLGGPNGSGWKKTAHSPDPKRIEPDNPLGLDDETIVRLFRLGKKLQQIAWGAALPPRNSNFAFHSVEEIYANNINRDELTSDPFGSGPLRLEWREGKVRIYSVGPDGEWNRGELSKPGDAELKGDLGVEIEIGRIDIHWLAEGAMLDYLQGKHTARYLAKKGTHYAVQFPLPQWAGEKLQFGPMVDGLRAAVELTTTNGEFAVGQPIEVRFHIRNEADYDIQIASDSWRQGDEAMIEDEQGRRAPVGKSWYSGESPTQREVLKPGQSATFKSSSLEFFPRTGATDPLTAKHPVGYTARVAPGKCTVRFRLRFPGWTAQFMDWRGELETGPVVIDLKPASENSLGPQTPSQQSIAHSALTAFFAVKSTPDCP